MYVYIYQHTYKVLSQCHPFGERCVYLINPVSTEHLTVFTELDQVNRNVGSADAEWVPGLRAGEMVVQCGDLACGRSSGVHALTPGRWVLQPGGGDTS